LYSILSVSNSFDVIICEEKIYKKFQKIIKRQKFKIQENKMLTGELKNKVDRIWEMFWKRKVA
jgi:hypothetical protein